MKREKLLFGTGGIPLSAEGEGNAGGIARCAQLGLGCMEIEYVYGVRATGAQTQAASDAAREHGIAVSAHAPYYINLNSKETEKVDASIVRILESARKVAASGGDRVVFHAAFYGGDPPEKVFKTVKKHLADIRHTLDREKLAHVSLRPELTGKPSHFGDIDELIRLSLEVRGVMPCVDFSHLYARYAGRYNSYSDFCMFLEKLGKELGGHALEDMHVHLSGIEYSAKGETKHAGAQQSAFRFDYVLKALKSFGVGGRVICESPARENDALLFQNKYRSMKPRRKT